MKKIVYKSNDHVKTGHWNFRQKFKAISTMLSAVLSDAVILYMKTRKFHWNVSGESFMEYHKLFEAQYKELEEAIDEVAERISKLGSQTIGTTKEFASMSQLKESPGKYPASMKWLKNSLQIMKL